jgi:hypothetical protein
VNPHKKYSPLSCNSKNLPVQKRAYVVALNCYLGEALLAFLPFAVIQDYGFGESCHHPYMVGMTGCNAMLMLTLLC